MKPAAADMIEPAYSHLGTPYSVMDCQAFVECCFSLSLRSVSASEDATVTPAPVINLQNANLVIVRTA